MIPSPALKMLMKPTNSSVMVMAIPLIKEHLIENGRQNTCMKSFDVTLEKTSVNKTKPIMESKMVIMLIMLVYLIVHFD